MPFLSDADTRSQLKAIGRAFVLLFGLAFGVVALFLVFLWELQSQPPFVEAGPLEFTQSFLLAASAALYFFEAYRRPDLRPALVLVAGFFTCMLIREQDYFLDFIQHGCWVYPALATAGLCLLYAGLNLRRTIAGLERFVRWKYFPYLLIGVVIVLAYSRLFGMRMVWETLLSDKFTYNAKTAMEESSELLGYLLVLTSAVLANTDKHLK
jgi:hypothetical protein